MRSGTDALALADKTLAFVSGADQAQVDVTLTDASYARFAGNYVPEPLIYCFTSC